MDVLVVNRLQESWRVLEAVLSILNTGAQWHMLPQKVSELQNCAPALSGSGVATQTLRRILTDVANDLLLTQACWMKKNASLTRPSLWPRAAARRSDPRSAEKA